MGLSLKNTWQTKDDVPTATSIFSHVICEKLWHIFLIAIKCTHKGNGRPWNYTKQARDNFGRPWNICKFVKVGGGARLLFYLLDAWIGSHSMLIASWARVSNSHYKNLLLKFHMSINKIVFFLDQTI